MSTTTLSYPLKFIDSFRHTLKSLSPVMCEKINHLWNDESVLEELSSGRRGLKVYKILEPIVDFNTYLPSRVKRCMLETMGRILKSQLDRSALYNNLCGLTLNPDEWTYDFLKKHDLASKYNYVNNIRRQIQKFEGQVIIDYKTEIANQKQENNNRILSIDYGLRKLLVITCFEMTDEGLPVQFSRPFFVDIKMQPGRIEITNPGRLINTVTIEKMKAGISISRNPIILKFMQNYRYADQLGRGIPMVFRKIATMPGFSIHLEARDEMFKARIDWSPLP
ncbi:ATP-binding protein [Desulfobacter latus]|uniref:ATP-dependent DNA helicase RecG C-terminal domain-containing protein n=1 Tax=Desulfobacter latus TaxID=2292 RepID=A0A850TBG9_9BACT|nr:ATP-binding protein [Desulfobacter latus]NWH05988.1 hypothetical protein [Desulfobacter latus]